MVPHVIILVNLVALLGLSGIYVLNLGGPAVQAFIEIALNVLLAVGYSLLSLGLSRGLPKMECRAIAILITVYLCLAVQGVHGLWPLYNLVQPLGVEGLYV